MNLDGTKPGIHKFEICNTSLKDINRNLYHVQAV